jgi:hypothetical protein
MQSERLSLPHSRAVVHGQQPATLAAAHREQAAALQMLLHIGHLVLPVAASAAEVGDSRCLQHGRIFVNLTHTVSVILGVDEHVEVSTM